MARRTTDFQTIRSEGGLLPPDLLRRVLGRKEELDGTRPEDYRLPEGERLNDAITQSWNRLRKHWAEFRVAAASLPEGAAGTGFTNDKWSIPLLRELGFGLLPTTAGPEIGGRTYAISRFFGATPIHLIGCGLSLDRRAAGVRGAAAVNPHGLVQEFLNRSDDHLWAIVSNGARFRVLRDSQALSRQSYLEFDLEAMFAGEVFSDFVLLWLMAHATRFAALEDGRLESCWLEQWTRIAQEQGTRALGDLRAGVEKALVMLGQGFVGHPRNAALREALRDGTLPLNEFHGQLLRVVYRLIFLFVAEDRTHGDISLLHPPDESGAGREARECYAAHYSAARLRELASRIRGSRHGDLWQQLNIVVGALSGEERFAPARELLALPVLGSLLWSPESTTLLNASSLTGAEGAELANADFLDSVRHLAFTRQNKVLRPVDYKNLGAEELGGVYESLLALTPQISGDGHRFTFAKFAGSERKMSGSYYTPDSLVQCLLDSALDPVVEQALEGKAGADAEQAILSIKVCDPAVGSGHFLVGAAHRLARHLARVRALAQGESEPSPLLYQHALRDVIGRCLYGVDINPMSAELCRVSLWLESLEPGKPLSFLDHHIRVGNSLLGTTPALIAGGLPDDAFKPIEGDDKKVCSALRKRNKQEREGGQQDMIHLMVAEPLAEYNTIADRTRGINEAPDETIDQVRDKAERFRRLVVSLEYRHAQQVADAWCAAFVWEKRADAPAEPLTTDTLRRLEADSQALTQAQRDERERLSRQCQFFHWYLAFPEVFANGGFDCVLGNPPWEHTELKEKEWFAERRPDIASARTGAERKRMIEALKHEDPHLYAAFAHARREHDGASHFLSDSGRYPLCGRGRINLYAVFGEGMRTLLSDRGRTGCVLPTGIATDDTTKYFFQDIVETRSLASLFSFENEEFVFPEVHHATRFCLLTVGSGARPLTDMAEFVFFARQVDHLRDPERRFTLSAEDIAHLNPNTRTCPIFRWRRDAVLTKAIYSRVPVLIRKAQDGRLEENPWGVTFRQGLFNMTSDSQLFSTREQLETDGWKLDGNIFRKENGEYLPLYEAKMIHHFDHRWGTYEGQTEAQANQGKLPELDARMHGDPQLASEPRYWVRDMEVDLALRTPWSRSWLLTWRDITGTEKVRTVITAIIPRVGVGHTSPIMFPVGEVAAIAGLYANLCSFALDYCARQKVNGTHLTYGYLEQLPIREPSCAGAPWLPGAAYSEWCLHRVLELVYTAWDVEPFAQDCGLSGPPFRWDEERRFLLRCELDAAIFHLYLAAEGNGEWRTADGETPEHVGRLIASFPTPRDAGDYMMETFPIVKRKDEKKYGSYRTKETILEIYDEMAEAMRAGEPYQTRLDPPPADPRCCHPAETRPEGLRYERQEPELRKVAEEQQ